MSLELHPAVRGLGVGLGALVLLVGGSLAAYTGLRSLAQVGAPTPPPPAPVVARPAQGADPTATLKRARLLAQQSHGNWARLSADDQRLLNSITGGHGREMLREMLRETPLTPVASKPRQKQ